MAFMRARGAALGIVLGGAVVAACSSFGSEANPSSGPGADASADPEASVIDAAPADGTTAGAHTFASDFEGNPFDRDWDGIEAHPVAGGSIALLPASESGNTFVRLSIPATADGLYESRALRKIVPGGSKKLTYTFRARITDANTKDGWFEIAAIAWGDLEGDRTHVGLRIYKLEASGAGFVPPSEYPTTSIAKPLAVGEWHSYTIAITPGSRSNVVEYFFDGSKLGAMTLSAKPSPTGDVALLLGVTSMGSPGNANEYDETVIDLDDVTYDVE